jgi:hypothetical protein
VTLEALPANTFIGSMSARQGAAEALRSVLLGVVANAGGGSVPDRGVRLLEVFTRWPTINERVCPCASVTDVTVDDNEDDCDTDAPEDAFSEELGAVMTLSETSGVFAVDLWTEDDAERQGFEAALHLPFRGQDFAHHIVVEAPPETLPAQWRGHFVLKVRLSLKKQLAPVDGAMSAENNEYRANGQIEWDAEIAVARPISRLAFVNNRGGVVAAGGFDDGSNDDDEEG